MCIYIKKEREGEKDYQKEKEKERNHSALPSIYTHNAIIN
jgi:hypothetical protein